MTSKDEDKAGAEIKRKIRRAAVTSALFNESFHVHDIAEHIAEGLGVSFDEAVALVEEYDRQAKSAWWHRHILRYNYCAACNVRDPALFMVPDRVWRFYVPEKLREEIICFACWKSLTTKKDNRAFEAEHGRPMGVPHGFPLEWESGEPMPAERWLAHWPRDYGMHKIPEHAHQQRALKKEIEDEISKIVSLKK